MNPIRLLLPIVFALLTSVPAAAQAPDERPEAAVAAAPAALQGITASELREHLEFLASDALEGRLTASEGQRMAARYVADQFQSAGLEPMGDPDGEGRSWFQAYPVRVGSVSSPSGLFAPDGSAVVAGGVWMGTPEKPIDVSGRLTFLGRGLPRRAKDLDLAEAIPVIAVNFGGRESRSPTGGLFRSMSQLMAIPRRLAETGAPAIVVLVKEFNAPLLSALNMMGVYEGKPQVRLKEGDGTDMMAMLQGMQSLPILLVAGKPAMDLLERLGVEPEKVFDAESDAVPEAATQERYRLRFDIEWKDTSAVNVVGVLRGRDPDRAGEAIVYSAHMDHVGMGANGEAYNGADDDGSGTSALLELAEAYGSLPPGERPARSVIFLSVSGEELGLWGSEHYASHPTWPLEKTVANINIDMIGRSTEKVPADTISLTPTYRHKAFSSLAREAAFLGQAFDLKMTNGDRFYQRSDHYNFARRDVPVVFFCDDEHPDYHQQTDDVEKIEFEKMERIVRLSFLLGYRTAERVERPSVLGRHSGWFE